MDRDPIAEDPPQIRIFFSCSPSGSEEAGIVGRCMFSVDVANKAPGGVYEARVTAWVNSVSPIWHDA